MARCPRPPMPITPTLCVGFTSNCTIGLNTVIPPQNSGPAVFASIPSGNGVAHAASHRTRSANPPKRPMIVDSAVPHKFRSPPMHWRQCIQLALNQPRPTRSPIFKLVTFRPTSATMPITSCPGTIGYELIPHSLSIMDRSEWQSPHDSTRISIWLPVSGPCLYWNGTRRPFYSCTAYALTTGISYPEK